MYTNTITHIYIYTYAQSLHTLNIIIIQCRWFPEVQNIFYNGNKRKQIPLAQLDQFFESSAVLMTNILRELALNSILEYEQVFCPPEVRVCVYTYIL